MFLACSIKHGHNIIDIDDTVHEELVISNKDNNEMFRGSPEKSTGITELVIDFFICFNINILLQL